MSTENYNFIQISMIKDYPFKNFWHKKFPSLSKKYRQHEKDYNHYANLWLKLISKEVVYRANREASPDCRDLTVLEYQYFFVKNREVINVLSKLQRSGKLNHVLPTLFNLITCGFLDDTKTNVEEVKVILIACLEANLDNAEDFNALPVSYLLNMITSLNQTRVLVRKLETY